VKGMFNHHAFRDRVGLSGVNSINFARIAAQVVYYFKGYFAATKNNSEKASFAVPSGNFGNIYAGHVARSMGLPIKKLILASNENDVLDRFFKTGEYSTRKAARETSSPSMDISKASNFERYVFDLVGRDGARVKELWRRIDKDGEFDLSGSAFYGKIPETGFVSGRSKHADRIAVIRKLFEKYETIVDPHTADGVKVGLEHREPGVPLVCLETALPVKFSATIREALGRDPERPAEFAGIEKRPQRFEVIAPDASLLQRMIERAAG